MCFPPSSLYDLPASVKAEAHAGVYLQNNLTIWAVIIPIIGYLILAKINRVLAVKCLVWQLKCTNLAVPCEWLLRQGHSHAVQGQGHVINQSQARKKALRIIFTLMGIFRHRQHWRFLTILRTHIAECVPLYIKHVGGANYIDYLPPTGIPILLNSSPFGRPIFENSQTVAPNASFCDLEMNVTLIARCGQAPLQIQNSF